MIDLSWHIEDEGRDPDVAGSPRPILSTWHFLRKALRRETRIWAGLAFFGGMLGLASLVVMPPASTGTVTLLLGRTSGTDPSTAMATDVSLLNTRAVANRVTDRLGLRMTPEAFQSTFSAEQVTSQILKITINGPDDKTALARTDTLVREYLSFRSEQMQSLTEVLISGYKTRTAALQQQVNTLTRQYSKFSAQGPDGQSRASDVLSRRTEFNAQITTMQRAVEEATLQTDAAIAATHVIDVPRVVPRSIKKAAVLNVGSGFIAGGALGMGLVLFRALTSERLRRRQEVAMALSAPVSFSVRSAGPPVRRIDTRRRGRWDWIGRRVRLRRGAGRAWRGRDLQTLIYGLESAIVPVTGRHPKPQAQVSRSAQATQASMSAAAAKSSRGRTSVAVDEPPTENENPSSVGQPGVSRDGARSRKRESQTRGAGRQEGTVLARDGRTQGSPAAAPGRVALAALGNAEAAADILAELAAHLGRLGVSAFLVDLSQSGALATAVASLPDGSKEPGYSAPRERIPEVYRPTKFPPLSRGPLGSVPGAISDFGEDHSQRPAWDAADVVLALVEVDPGLAVENLRTWVTQVVPLVTAGRSNAELLGSIAQLIRSAGLDLPFAMLLGADKTDESLGLPDVADPTSTGRSSGQSVQQ